MKKVSLNGLSANQLEAEGAKSAAQRMAEMYKRRKDSGFVRRDRWAHPDDWPEIDELISKLVEQRKNDQ